MPNTLSTSPDGPIAAPRPVHALGGSLWHRLFADAASTVLTLAALALAVQALRLSVDWALVRAVWPGSDAGACRTASGACSAFLGEKGRQILFGIYPPGEQWRPAVVCVTILALAVATLPPRHWRRPLGVAWAACLALSLGLMAGGFAGLAPVPTSAWGGLPVTLLLATCCLGAGLPFGIALALGRRSALPVPRWLSIGVIELIRGLPLVSLLFVASILLPLMLPDGVSIDGLLRAAAALTVFSAAYLAEVIRGGLQAVPRGQQEAAGSLGLTWWQTTRLVVLPQAIGHVIPPLTNTAIVMIKNTSLVLIIGLFDLLSSGRAALTDPTWPTPYAETYLFIAAIYFALCFSLSRYALWLETRFQRHAH